MTKASQRILEAVSGFNKLPPEAFIPIAVVAMLRGSSVSTAWRDVKRGILPKPHNIGLRMTRFNVGELRKAMGLPGGEGK